jgi:hypothetical protein
MKFILKQMTFLQMATHILSMRLLTLRKVDQLKA